MTRLLPALVAAIACGGFLAPAGAAAPKDAPRPSARLVSFDDLQRRRGDPLLRLLDARPRAEFEQGHIPGALWVDTRAAEALAARPGGLADRDAWEAWLAPLGIGPDTEVLVYDARRQLDAARLWWLLSYLGVEKVGLVDGGFPLWQAQGRPVTKDLPAVQPQAFPVAFRAERHATREDVLAALRTGGVRIVDARSAAEHAGAEVRSQRGGRIPTACSLEWSGLVDPDGRFLDEAALRARLEALGVRPGEPVIAHCQGGGRASVNTFVLERLGHPARNYYLGWSDWGNAAETPVEAGTPGAGKP